MADESRLKTIDEQFKQTDGKPKDEHIAEMVHKHFKEAWTARVAKDQEFLEQYKIYRFYAQTRKFPWRANIYIPMGHVNAVVKTAKYVTAVLGSDPFFKPVAKQSMFAANEKAVENLMLAQHDDMELPLIFHDWFLDMCIFGVGIVKLFWKYDEEIEEITETQQQPVYAQMNGELIQIDVEPVEVKYNVPTVTFDGPMAEVVSIFDFYIDPQATEIKNARYVIHRKDVTADYLKDRADKGIYDKAAVNKILSEHPTGKTHSSEKAEIESIEDNDTYHGRSDTIEILEYWTPRKTCLAGPNNTLLKPWRKNEAKRIPFIAGKHQRNAHRFFGIGVNEPVKSLQEAINDTHNIRFDNWKLTVQKMLLVDTGAILTPSDLVVRPGGIVRTKPGYDPAKAVVELHKGVLPVESYAEEDRLWHLNDTVTAITDRAKGTQTGIEGEQTATAVRQQAMGLSTRFGLDLIVLEPAIKEFLQLQHTLNQQFLDFPREVRVMADDGYQYPMIGPMEVQGAYDFKFELSPIQGNREVWLQRVLLVFNTLAKVPFMMPLVNWPELSKRLLKASDLRNPDQLLNLQNAPMMMQQLAMQGLLMPQMGQATGEGMAQNPEQARMNAKTRTPQPTPNDMVRDIFAGAQ